MPQPTKAMPRGSNISRSYVRLVSLKAEARLAQENAWQSCGRHQALRPHLSGYIRVQAETLEAAKKLLEGNPVFEAGGTVEIRELPRG